LTGIDITKTTTNPSSSANISAEISYDLLGNTDIININNADISEISYEWSRGNVLDSIDISHINSLSANDKSISYTYNDSNIRTKKVIEQGSLDDTSVEYFWGNGLLIGESITCDGTSFYSQGLYDFRGDYNTIVLYDQSNNAYGFVVNKENNGLTESEVFYYLKDATNTIYAVINENGERVVTYEYDDFANPTISCTSDDDFITAFLNPLIYRDYIYDYESEMYYLQSRYYNPQIGRFISADAMMDTSMETVMSTNMYAYCENNPINHQDRTGYVTTSVLGNINSVYVNNANDRYFGALSFIHTKGINASVLN
jgi:RHS repeat-associated protein